MRRTGRNRYLSCGGQSFSNWKAYNEICALGGWEGRDEKSGPMFIGKIMR
jgi:hypothetical protein